MEFIKEYNYSKIITEKDQKKAKNLIDDLFKTGNWDNSKPKFQTHLNLFLYEELEIFKKTFLQSCSEYLGIKNISEYKIYMWCYKTNLISNFWDKRDLWHCHNDSNSNAISGLYYLRNFKNEGTEFENFKINPQQYTWYIYPSHILHRPPKTKSFRNRYTIAADLWK